MDVSKKPTCNDKKMVIKMGAGGVATVILFGGALATAAFASAFIVGLKKRRSSVVKPAKKSEANDQFVFVDKVSSVVSKEVESDCALLGDAALDEKTDIDNDGNRVEHSGDGEMKGMDRKEAEKVTEAENIIKGNVEECCDEEESGSVSVETPEMEAEKINRKRKTDVESQMNGETEEVSGVEKPKLDFAANEDSDLNEGVPPTDMVDATDGVISENQEITKNNDVTEGVAGVAEGVREDEVKHVVEEELLEEEQKDIHQFDAKRVTEELSKHEKSEEVDEEKSNNENQELGDCEKNVENSPILEKEKVVDDSSKTTDIDAEENTVNEADLSATTDTDTNEIEKGETGVIVDYDEMELSDEAEESSVGTGESSTDSNSDAVWPAEESSETRQVNLINQEVAGKALEDKKPDAGNDFHNPETNLDKESLRDSIYRNTVKKYLSEFSMVKDQPENAIKKGMLILILSVFSSYSCSWLFGCSFVKLSLIMFFSIVLSKIHGY